MVCNIYNDLKFFAYLFLLILSIIRPRLTNLLLMTIVFVVFYLPLSAFPFPILSPYHRTETISRTFGAATDQREVGQSVIKIQLCFIPRWQAVDIQPVYIDFWLSSTGKCLLGMIKHGEAFVFFVP